MEMASNFVKELRDLVKKKPKNGTVASMSSLEDEEETDSPLTPRKFEQSFLDGKCKNPVMKKLIKWGICWAKIHFVNQVCKSYIAWAFNMVRLIAL